MSGSLEWARPALTSRFGPVDDVRDIAGELGHHTLHHMLLEVAGAVGLVLTPTCLQALEGQVPVKVGGTGVCGVEMACKGLECVWWEWAGRDLCV